jgi:hypothetical protein
LGDGQVSTAGIGVKEDIRRGSLAMEWGIIRERKKWER